MRLLDEILARIKEGAEQALTDQQILELEVRSWLASPRRAMMLAGERYYRGRHDVYDKRRTVIGPGGQLVDAPNLSNNKLVSAFFRKIVDQKVSYILGIEPQIQAEEDRYHELLAGYFDFHFWNILRETLKRAIIQGVAYLHPYYDEEGALRWLVVPGDQGIPIWRDETRRVMEAFIRVYGQDVYEGRTKVRLIKVERWTTQGVERYVLDERLAQQYGYDTALVPDFASPTPAGHFVLTVGDQEIPYVWERVPFIPVRYNFEEIGLLEIVKSLIDDYDRKMSVMADIIDDTPSAIYVLKNYDGTDLGEFRKNLASYRAVKVTDDGGVEALQTSIDAEAYKVHMDMLRKNIYEFARAVDTQAEAYRDKSGVALKFVYADLDLDANVIETQLKYTLDDVLWFVDKDIARRGLGEFDAAKVSFAFSRDMVINEAELVQMARTSVGILSDETILAHHPWVDDPQAEMERKRTEREDALPYAFEMQQRAQNEPPPAGE